MAKKYSKLVQQPKLSSHLPFPKGGSTVCIIKKVPVNFAELGQEGPSKYTLVNTPTTTMTIRPMTS